jgi:hypothetical protein
MDSIGTDLIYGLIGVFLLNFRNPDKKSLIVISVFMVGLFISQFLFFAIGHLVGNIIYIISSLGLLISYIDRFNNKEEKEVIDFFKVGAIILLVIYPYPFYSLFSVGRSNFWEVLRFMTFFILGIIYLYDRWILKPEKMKKKFVIIMTIQTVLIGLFFIYAYLQKLTADKQVENSFQVRIQAEQQLTDMRKEIDKLKVEIENCR